MKSLPQRDPPDLKGCAELLSALAAPERLRIVRFLRDGKRTVTEIAEMLETSAVNTGHHLQVLRNAGLIQSEKRGRFVDYSIVPGVLERGGEIGDLVNLGCCRLELPRSDKGGE